MDERRLRQTFDHDEDDTINDAFTRCIIESDNDSTESTSSNETEDETTLSTVSSLTGSKESPPSHLGGISRDSRNVSLEPFVHQVGGHIPMVCLDADTVCKPLIDREHKFYQSLPESLKRFTPQFDGLMHIEIQANPDGCIALTGNPPSSRRRLKAPRDNDLKRENKRMKSRQKLHLLLQHLQNGEKAQRSHEFEWNDSKSRRSSKIELNGRNVYGGVSDDNRAQASKEQISANDDPRKCHKKLLVDEEIANKDKMSSGSNIDLELFYNPWALKCHQDHFKKLGLKSSNTVAISSKLEPRDVVEAFPKTRCTYLLLENVVSNHTRPCVLDIKVGARQYPDDCSSAKKKSKMIKSAQTTSATLGLRLCGMQVFDTVSKKYTCLNKYHGRALTDETFVDSIRQFLNKKDNQDDRGFRDDVRKKLILKLLELKKELKKLDSFRFYTSSLLVTYDGYINFQVPENHANSILEPCDNDVASHSDDGDETNGDNLSPSSAKGDISSCNQGRNESQNSNQLVDVRLIDFAHATHIGMNDKATYEGPDDNFISGISNFISILNKL